MLLFEAIITSMFLGLVIVMSAIVFPDFIDQHVKNKKAEKFLEHPFVKACWTLLTVFVDILLIVWFVNLIC